MKYALLALAAICTAAVFGAPQSAAARSSRAAVSSVCPQYIVAKSLVYPKPGAAHVSADIGLTVISGLSAKGTVALQPRIGKPIFSNTSIVSGAGTAFQLPRLDDHETYTVFVQEAAASPLPRRCPNTVPMQLGTFSTR